MSNQKPIHRVVARLLLGCLLLYFILYTALVVAATLTTDESYTALPESSSSYIEPTVEHPTETPTEPTELTTPLVFSEITYTKPATITEAYSMYDNVYMSINLLWNELECQLYSVEAKTIMEHEVERLNKIYEAIKHDIACFSLWDEKLEEYPYATKTWKYLKDLGYSDVACAGIIGNLMAECGGHTLKLDPHIDDTNGQYYGMFQWSAKYYPAVVGASFEEQLDFYAKTSEPIFKTWGKNYASGFTIDDFNWLTDPREAALAFAKIYERCASWTYERRQNFSEIAYQYFVLDFENL